MYIISENASHLNAFCVSTDYVVSMQENLNMNVHVVNTMYTNDIIILQLSLTMNLNSVDFSLGKIHNTVLYMRTQPCMHMCTCVATYIRMCLPSK